MRQEEQKDNLFHSIIAALKLVFKHHESLESVWDYVLWAENCTPGRVTQC